MKKIFEISKKEINEKEISPGSIFSKILLFIVYTISLASIILINSSITEIPSLQLDNSKLSLLILLSVMIFYRSIYYLIWLLLLGLIMTIFKLNNSNIYKYYTSFTITFYICMIIIYFFTLNLK
ncbi:hypothetical protein [Clostridioides difficile]|uniref:hypothetical protein n=1 Tax=Clostridioides difficile TaxID=1496 RepID=UPI000D1DDD84|nr:hypothetical protein [Clostridioides difficile]HBE9444548.1 hypothetical protein [Clostridioides difficile]